MFGSRILTYVLGAAIIYLMYANGRMAMLNLTYQHRLHQLEHQIGEAKQREVELVQKIEESKTEAHLEKVARTVLGLVKKDEIAYQINKD